MRRTCVCVVNRLKGRGLTVSDNEHIRSPCKTCVSTQGTPATGLSEGGFFCDRGLLNCWRIGSNG